MTDNSLIDYVSDVEYAHFDTPPASSDSKGAPGHYFKLPGDDIWRGAFAGLDDAQETARHSLFQQEQAAVHAELIKSGFLLTNKVDAAQYTLNAKDRWFQIYLDDEVIDCQEAFTDGRVKSVGRFEFDDGQETFGSQLIAVKSAIRTIAMELRYHNQGRIPRMVYDENAVTAIIVNETIGQIKYGEGPEGLRQWAFRIGRSELRYQSLAIAEQIDEVYNSFTNFEFDDVSFEDDFVPAMLQAFTYPTDGDAAPKLSGGVDGGITFARDHFGLEPKETMKR